MLVIIVLEHEIPAGQVQTLPIHVQCPKLPYGYEKSSQTTN